MDCKPPARPSPPANGHSQGQRLRALPALDDPQTHHEIERFLDAALRAIQRGDWNRAAVRADDGPIKE